jgi:hypothetical protein
MPSSTNRHRTVPGRIAAAVVVCVVGTELCAAAPLAAQTVPVTACDAALADPEFHFPRGMRIETGATAFSYGSLDRPFATRSGAQWTLVVELGFDPGRDARIRFAAIDEMCSGSGSAGTVLDYKFSDVKTRTNAIVYDLEESTIAFNGLEPQRVTPLGTPRYAWLEVWDGVTARASYSYLVDLVNSAPPIER